MNVGHRDRRADDAGQVRDVAHLLQALVRADGLHQALVGVDDAVDAHAAFARKADSELIDPLELQHSDLSISAAPDLRLT
jgi:hypothetical protein